MSDDSKVTSHLTGRTIWVELPEGGQLLFADIEIDCPLCGQHAIRFAGHHLRAIRDFLISVIDQYPDLTGKDGDYRQIESLKWRGPGGQDPSAN